MKKLLRGLKRATTLVAGISICFLSAGQALAASPYHTKDGISATGAPNPNWELISLGGPNCISGSPVTLSTSFTSAISPQIKGRNGVAAGNTQPIVSLNSGPSVTNLGLTIPANAILMHPGPTGECAILRYKATTAGTYSVQARFQGAYTGGNIAPPGITSDGVVGMVNLHNGGASKIIGNIDTQTNRTGEAQTSQAFTLTCDQIRRGVFIDFAIHMKSAYWYDSTNMGGKIDVKNEVECPNDPPPPKVVVCCTPASDATMGNMMGNMFIRSESAASSSGKLTYQVTNAFNPMMQAYTQYVAAATNGGSGSGCAPITITYTVKNVSTGAIAGTLAATYPANGGAPSISSSGGFTLVSGNWELSGLALNTQYDVKATTSFACAVSPTGERICPNRGFFFSIGFSTYRSAAPSAPNSQGANISVY